MAKLTNKQKKFIDEYLIDLNASAAARRAGYSAKTANRIASENLAKPHIQAAIQKAMQEREKRTKITQDNVLEELAKIGFADIKDFLSYRTEKTLIDISDEGEKVYGYQQIVNAKPSEEVDGAVVNEISIGKDGTFKFKMNDKMKALEMIGRHLGMWNDKLQLGGDIEIDVHLVDDEDGED